MRPKVTAGGATTGGGGGATTGAGGGRWARLREAKAGEVLLGDEELVLQRRPLAIEPCEILAQLRASLVGGPVAGNLRFAPTDVAASALEPARRRVHPIRRLVVARERRVAAAAVLVAGEAVAKGVVRLAILRQPGAPSLQIAHFVRLDVGARAGFAMLGHAFGRMAGAAVGKPELVPVHLRALTLVDRGRRATAERERDRRDRGKASDQRALTRRPLASKLTHGHGVL